MHLNYRNINDAFHGLVNGIHNGSIPTSKQDSRNGKVLVVQEPILITYQKPTERVLFNSSRDWPCFFTLYEALWMLAGRNDVDSVAYYAKQMMEYSDDGKTLNGAYGYRWRNARRMRPLSNDVCPRAYLESEEPYDQLRVIIDHLKANPASRRAVLQMWNVKDDLLKVDSSKDVCCNLSVMFSLRDATRYDIETHAHNGYLLDMTVTNRSNDMIWGLLGTNYVHFTILQEYIAAYLGVGVGRYHHFTNNLHIYEWNWHPEEWLAANHGFPASNTKDWGSPYPSNLMPLIQDPEVFEQELPTVVDRFNGVVKQPNLDIDSLFEPFMRHVAVPMLRAFELHKTYGETQTALRMCELILAYDWRIAATQWLGRRRAKNEAQNKD